MCTGTRYFENLVDESKTTLEEQYMALSERYMKTNCACFTPNTGRIDDILRLCKGSLSLAIFISLRLNLPLQGLNIVIFRLGFLNNSAGFLDVSLFNQQTHTARELSLNASGSGCNAVFDIVGVQNIVELQALFVGFKQYVPANYCLGISHC